MPYLLEIDQDVNCAFIKHEAPFDLTNLALSGDERLAHPGFRRKMNFLHDFTDLIIPAEIEFKTIADESKRIIREYNLIHRRLF